MYSASQDYWDAVWNPSRILSIRIEITGTAPGATPITLTENSVKSFSLDDQLMSDDRIEIGNAVMRTVNFSFYDENSSSLEIGLGGSPIDIYLGVDGEEVYLGQFFANEAYHNGIVTTIEAVDAMGYANVNYNSTSAFPMSVYDLLVDVCAVADLTLDNVSIPHGNLVILAPPEEEVTCRQMLGYIADIAGGSFRIVRDNSDKIVEFITINSTGETIPLESTFTEDVADEPVLVTGATYGEYLQGDPTFTINVASNPLMDQLNGSDIYDILSDIVDTYSSVSFYPCRVNASSNAAFETGDVVDFTHRDGSTFSAIITHITQEGLSKMQTIGAGETIQKNNYVVRGPLTSRVRAIDNTLKIQSGFIHIDTSVPSLTLGRDDSDASVVITNENVTINGSDGASAVLESSQLTAPQASFKNTYMGNWMWVSRTVNGTPDQALSLKWVGG